MRFQVNRDVFSEAVSFVVKLLPQRTTLGLWQTRDDLMPIAFDRLTQRGWRARGKVNKAGQRSPPLDGDAIVVAQRRLPPWSLAMVEVIVRRAGFLRAYAQVGQGTGLAGQAGHQRERPRGRQRAAVARGNRERMGYSVQLGRQVGCSNYTGTRPKTSPEV